MDLPTFAMDGFDSIEHPPQRSGIAHKVVTTPHDVVVRTLCRDTPNCGVTAKDGLDPFIRNGRAQRQDQRDRPVRCRGALFGQRQPGTVVRPCPPLRLAVELSDVRRRDVAQKTAQFDEQGLWRKREN